MFCQQDDIAGALRQGRHHDRKDVQTVEKVFAEQFFRHEVFQVAAGRGEETDIGMQFLVAADAGKGPFLQEAEQFHLSLHGEVADLVEEQGAAVSGFRAADTPGNCSGESSFFMSEQFTFDQILGESRAVQGDERLVFAVGEFDDGVGEQFLAGAAGAADQHGGVGRSDLAEFGIDLLHFAAVADQFSRRVLQHIAQFAVFFEERLLFLMQQQTFGCGIGGDAGEDLQKSGVAFEIGVRRDRTVHGKRADQPVMMEQRDADERRWSVVMMSARAVEEPRIAAEIRDHMAAAGLGDMACDAFAEIIKPFFLFRLGQTVGSFDLERVPVAERESAAAHTHFAVDDLKHFFQHGLDVASVDQHRTDLLYHQNLRMDLCFHNDCNIHAFRAVIKREK